MADVGKLLLCYGCRMNGIVHVAILSSSVVMAGIVHLLRTRPGLRVHVVECADDLLHLLEATYPDVLIFELANAAIDDVRPFVRRHGGALTLIGIDIPHRQARTFTSQANSLISLDDLVQLLDGVPTPTTAAPVFMAQ